jgi:hypothetical protein
MTLFIKKYIFLGETLIRTLTNPPNPSPLGECGGWVGGMIVC